MCVLHQTLYVCLNINCIIFISSCYLNNVQWHQSAKFKLIQCYQSIHEIMKAKIKVVSTNIEDTKATLQEM